MGQCGEFGCAHWATAADLVIRYGPRPTAADLVIRYGPLREMKPYSKICIGFLAMGHSAGFGYALWAIAYGLVIRYGP
jgi:hypothetical protein